jgi:hypothetical protein
VKLETREFSREAYNGINEIKQNLHSSYHKKASSLIQGLPAYIATWGLHRLSGDASRYSNRTSEDTGYKSTVYAKFLEKLQAFYNQDGNQDDCEFSEAGLLHMDLRHYTTLNHLALQLAKEWSFWAVAVLGEEGDNSSGDNSSGDNNHDQ